ncbi:MAG: ATP-binding protein, partial [Terriglobales bacterium]
MTSASFTELEHLRVRVRLLKGMATNINSGLDAAQLVERTLLEAHKSLPEFRLSYSTLDEATGEMAVVSSVAPLNMAGTEGKRFDLKKTQNLAGILRAGTPVAITDIETDERTAGLREAAKLLHTRALLYVPVQHPQGSPALVGLASPVPHEWSRHEIDMLTDMAGYLAIAIREASMDQEREQMDRQLRESQKMEAVGRLVGGVAHDFNNLLTGITIYSGLLSSALGGASPLQRHVREIQTAGERGASLVAQLLSLSRTHVLEPRVLSLNEVVQGMGEMLALLVGEDVRIECRLAAEPGWGLLDEDLLRQTILNLAINARDAMPRGGVLTFRTRRVEADAGLMAQVPGMLAGAYTVLTVSDTGSGMSSESLTHCFEPFYTTKAQGEGTGLGLASVYGMVLQHSGFITVRSLPGQGATFELYFPVMPESGVDADGNHGGSGRRGTVMLVEDEATLRLPLAEQLEAEGYHVLSGANGEAALLVAENFSGVIDVLVTDLVMPGMSGAELAERLAA